MVQKWNELSSLTNKIDVMSKYLHQSSLFEPINLEIISAEVGRPVTEIMTVPCGSFGMIKSII